MFKAKGPCTITIAGQTFQGQLIEAAGVLDIRPANYDVSDLKCWSCGKSHTTTEGHIFCHEVNRPPIQ